MSPRVSTSPHDPVKLTVIVTRAVAETLEEALRTGLYGLGSTIDHVAARFLADHSRLVVLELRQMGRRQ